MYQEILYEIVIFDHIWWGGGWYMNIYGRILLRPERSSAARRCACFPNFQMPQLRSIIYLFVYFHLYLYTSSITYLHFCNDIMVGAIDRDSTEKINLSDVERELETKNKSTKKYFGDL